MCHVQVQVRWFQSVWAWWAIFHLRQKICQIAGKRGLAFDKHKPILVSKQHHGHPHIPWCSEVHPSSSQKNQRYKKDAAYDVWFWSQWFWSQWFSRSKYVPQVHPFADFKWELFTVRMGLQDLGPLDRVTNLPIIEPLWAQFVNDFIVDLSRFEHNFIWPNSIQPTKIAWIYSVHVWKKMLLPFAKTNYPCFWGEVTSNRWGPTLWLNPTVETKRQTNNQTIRNDWHHGTENPHFNAKTYVCYPDSASNGYPHRVYRAYLNGSKWGTLKFPWWENVGKL